MAFTFSKARVLSYTYHIFQFLPSYDLGKSAISGFLFAPFWFLLLVHSFQAFSDEMDIFFHFFFFLILVPWKCGLLISEVGSVLDALFLSVSEVPL